MNAREKRKLRWATGVFWFLLAYIIAALVWWFISLQKQNLQMQHLEEQLLSQKFDPRQQPAQYTEALGQLQQEASRNLTKYLGEGFTFLALILISAIFIYRSVSRQFKVQQQQQHFMMAVTHELKTPIAVTKLNLETLKKHQLDEAKRDRVISNTLEETNRLNVLTNNILLSSQLEGKSYHIAWEELNVSDLVTSSIAEFRSRFPQRELRVHIEEDCELKGDPLLLKILVNNLLENAHKYAPAGTPVYCRLFTRTPYTELQVSDEGPGIPASEKKKIFEKFYRIGDENTRLAKGTGLGLYLCKKIATDHHGTISVTENSPKGSTFAVRFKNTR